MRKQIGIAIVTATAMLTLAARTSASDSLALTGESRLWVEGTSSVRDFSCGTKSLVAGIESAHPNAAAALLAAEKAVGAVTFEVAVEKLDCGNTTMNGHMLKALKGSTFKTVSFKLDSYKLDKAADGTHATLSGTLKLGGIEKAITLPVDLADAGNGAVRVKGVYPLNMKDYDLAPPTLMLGALKVSPNVKVNFDLVLAQ